MERDNDWNHSLGVRQRATHLLDFAEANVGKAIGYLGFCLIPIVFLVVAMLTPVDDLDAGWRARAKREVRQQWASNQRANVQTSQPVAASMCGNPSCPSGCGVDCSCEGMQQRGRISQSGGGSKSIVEPMVLTAAAFNFIPDDDAAFAVAQDPVATLPGSGGQAGGEISITAIDFNPMADDLFAVSTDASPAPKHILTYSEAYHAGGEFILIVGPDQTAVMMQDIVSCPVAHADSLGTTPAGIYRVYDSPNGKLMSPWTSTEDIAADKWQKPQAKVSSQPQWQRVCTPQGCQWIQVK